MDLAQAIILGLIQGITEFLPVSSSAHLQLLPMLTGWPDQGQIIDISLHVGTLFAVLLAFRHDVAAVLVGMIHTIKQHNTPQRQFFISLLSATIPALVVFAVIELAFGAQFRHPKVVAVSTIIFATILLYVDFTRPTLRAPIPPAASDAVRVGFIQAASVIPGASRLGTCLIGLRHLGYDRSFALRYALLLSVPLVVAAVGKKSLSIISEGIRIDWLPVLVSMSTAFVVGYATLSLVQMWLKRGGSFIPFLIYRILMGFALLWWL